MKQRQQPIAIKLQKTAGKKGIGPPTQPAGRLGGRRKNKTERRVYETGQLIRSKKSQPVGY